MIYLKIFWLLTIIFFIIYFSGIVFKWKLVKSITDEFGILFFMGLASLLIVAIAKGDPLTIAGIIIPTEFQWLGSLFVTWFGAWKFYFNPLKIKVYSMDREIGEVRGEIKGVRGEISSIKSDVRLIKEKIITGKRKR